MIGVAASQVPDPGEVTLDHLAHWVPDIDAAAQRLEQLGFTLTPYSSQLMPPIPGDDPAPAGTGNRCIMLERGYIEILTPEGDTPNAQTLLKGMERYVGVHLVCFGAADAGETIARLTQSGLPPLAPVHLQRRIGTETGEGLARFTVLRLPPGVMEEGRIQYCVHHTPELLWQQRWIDHPNGALGLESVMILVAKPQDAAKRYERFFGRPGQRIAGHDTAFPLDHGSVTLMEKAPGLPTPPSLPFIASYVVRVRDLDATWRYLTHAKAGAKRNRHDVISVDLGPAVGGTLVFQG
jgi:hypothetical protein